MALKPLELPQAGGERERSAQWAQVAAEEPLDEEPGREQEKRPGDKGPVTQEAKDDRGLERLDLGKALGLRHRAQRHRE